MEIRKVPRGEKFRITIHRSTIEQLDQAIKDLEDRGFYVIKRGVTEGEAVCYSTTNKKHAKYEFTGTTKYNKAWAKLEKKN